MGKKGVSKYLEQVLKGWQQVEWGDCGTTEMQCWCQELFIETE